MSKHLSVRLSNTLCDAVTQFARSEKRTVSNAVECLLERGLEVNGIEVMEESDENVEGDASKSGDGVRVVRGGSGRGNGRRTVRGLPKAHGESGRGDASETGVVTEPQSESGAVGSSAREDTRETEPVKTKGKIHDCGMFMRDCGRTWRCDFCKKDVKKS